MNSIFQMVKSDQRENNFYHHRSIPRFAEFCMAMRWSHKVITDQS